MRVLQSQGGNTKVVRITDYSIMKHFPGAWNSSHWLKASPVLTNQSTYIHMYVCSLSSLKLNLLHVAGKDKVQLLCGSLTVECQLSSTQAGMNTQQSNPIALKLWASF